MNGHVQDGRDEYALLEPWGKARAGADDECQWHPLVYHCLDVAAVTLELLKRRPVTRQRAGWLLGLSEEATTPLLVRLAALHDIGKFAPAFQQKASPAGWKWPSRIDAALASRGRTDGHPADAQLLWDGALESRFAKVIWPQGTKWLEQLMPATFGHHGRPVKLGSSTRYSPEDVFGEGAIELATMFIGRVCDLVSTPADTAPRGAASRAKRASWWVAGLITLADWVGSNRQWFPYRPPRTHDHELHGYWSEARDRAERAVRAAGLISPTPASGLGYSEIAKIASPTPLQREMMSVSLGVGPVLAIVEDATGAGKTEAAQMFVHRLMAETRASGAFWALPTKATANAMYERQANILGALFEPAQNRKPSLVLAHGGAHLHDGFRSTVITDELELAGTHTHDSLDDLTAEQACAAFLADDRRAGLLADIGVGTVDQAFLGVLPVRFSALRLFALAEKVLVVDEVHAFDEYMRAEAEGLMRAHAALGGSAVLLSATLTSEQRARLIDAWRASSDDEPDEPIRNASSLDSYPLLTVVADGGRAVAQRTFESPAWTQRTVNARWLSSDDEALAAVVSAVRGGACVAWIRNTVGTCIRSAQALEVAGLQPVVFHARFAPGDRQRIEREVLARFGKRSTSRERRGQVLVATQVVEQSLDLDFDVMISDVAPVDLLIQRAGRLWRHPRSIAERCAGSTPELHVLAGPLRGDVDADWVSALGTGTEWVYRDPAVLWRGTHALAQSGGIVAPSGLRDLVEAAYGDGPVPASFSAAMERATGERLSARNIASQSVQRLDRGYGEVASAWATDALYPTRLGEDTISLRLARVGTNADLEPWESDAGLALWQRWEMSEVSVRLAQLRGATTCPSRWSAAVARARASWSAFDQQQPVVVLEEGEARDWQGELVTNDDRRVLGVRYSERTGLILEHSR